MGKTVVTARIDGGLLEWVDGFAVRRGVPRTAIIDEALREFRVAREGVSGLSPSRDLAAVQDEANALREARLRVAGPPAVDPAARPVSRRDMTPAERLVERDRLRAVAAGHAAREKAERERKYAERGW